MKRVLLVSYLFPPTGGAGVQRALKWVKYLPSHGWRATVLTTASGWYPAKDPTLAKDIPSGTRVIRARDPGLLRFAAAGLEAARVPRAPSVLGFPDQMAAWIPAAVASGLREIRRERPDALITTSAPYSAHLVGLALARRTGIPWIADFRDEWSDNADAGGRAPWPVGAWAERWERRIVETADAVTVTSDAARLAGTPRRRLTITNGVDEEDAPEAAAPPKGERMRIAHVGTLYGDRDAGPILRGLASLGDVRAEFRQVGNVWVPGELDAGSVPVVQTGYVDHASAVAEMQSAHVLALHIPAVSRAIPGKLFEYLAAGRPILAVLHRGNPAFSILSEIGAGGAFEADDFDGIREALRGFYRDWEAGRGGAPPVPRERVLERFGRRRLAGELAALLDGLAGEREVVGAQERDGLERPGQRG